MEQLYLNELKQDIEAIETARTVTVATKLCNTQHMLSELQWDSLESRRKNHRLGLMYKMNTDLAPDYLSNLLPTASQYRYALLITLKTHHSFNAKQN